VSAACSQAAVVFGLQHIDDGMGMAFDVSSQLINLMFRVPFYFPSSSPNQS
jgi:hypothetical protein